MNECSSVGFNYEVLVVGLFAIIAALLPALITYLYKRNLDKMECKQILFDVYRACLNRFPLEQFSPIRERMEQNHYRISRFYEKEWTAMHALANCWGDKDPFRFFGAELQLKYNDFFKIKKKKLKK